MHLEQPFAPSRRGVGNIKPNPMLDLDRELAKYPPYDAEHNPDGVLDISSSLNLLMRDEAASFVTDHVHVDPAKVLEYGETAGSAALTGAVARFLNRHFRPSSPVDAAHIMAANGVTALLDIVSFAVCDDGEAILVATPMYGMFMSNLQTRNNIAVMEVPLHDVEGEGTNPNTDTFDGRNAAMVVDRFAAALMAARSRKLAVRGLLLCNPCNPMGRAYPRRTLVALAQFCHRNDLHLISDEIYAMSIHPPVTVSSQLLSPSTAPVMAPFTSVLSVVDEAGVDGRNIHVLYGASKDWGLGGLRLGFLVSQHPTLWEACRRLGPQH
ncbi:hypothetical protein Sste5346_000043 [Sporothrix stenoceras]|uniref:Aminotransferase class I/classII large domain-containing protein n=1 Tax=Sporothrix stenoceras TaxID=5173 RepID=A0ABR3ZTE2_9PEZI